MTDTVNPTVEEVETVKTLAYLMEADHVVVCLGGLTTHINGSPIFSCKVYGPFTKDEVEQKAGEINLIEGGAVMVRPLVDLEDTYRRMSAD